MEALFKAPPIATSPAGGAKRPERYTSSAVGGGKIHPFKRLMKALSRCLGGKAQFFIFGLPARDNASGPTSNDSLAFVSDGIASSLGANLTAQGRYIPSLTLGAGPFIESRFLRKQRCFPKIHRTGGKVVSLIDEGQQNYYRWLMETLPRIRFLEETGVSYDELYACQSRPFHQESLRLLKPDAVKIRASNELANLQAACLVVPRFVTEDEPWVVPWLRERISPLLPCSSATTSPRRLYISRSRAAGRRIANEPALIELLREFEFSTLLLEECSWLEQVRLFRDAEAIVGAHGAGLANVVFCTSALVIELIADAYPFTFYPQLSRGLNLEHHCLSSRPLNPAKVYSSDLEAPLSQVREILKATFGERLM